MKEQPIFLGHFEFESEESPLSLTFWQGSKTYHFLTNFKAVYPIVPIRLSVAKKKSLIPVMDKKRDLESRLNQAGLQQVRQVDVRQGQFFAEATTNNLAQFLMDRRDFEKLDRKTREEFTTNYTQSFMWDYGYLRKVEFEPWLMELLEQKNQLDLIFKGIYNQMLQANKLPMEPALSSVTQTISREYARSDFEKTIVTAAFKEIGYEFSQGILERVLHLFKETRYSLDNAYHFLHADKKVFEPLGITRDHPHPKAEASRKYFEQILSKDFSERFFDNCTIVFGEKGLSTREVASKSYDYVRKEEQAFILARLKELLRARTKYVGDLEYAEHIKYQLEELFAKVNDFKAEAKTRKELARLFKLLPKQVEQMHIQESYSESIRCAAQELEKARQDLEQRINRINPNNKVFYDFEKQRMLLFLDIMHRDEKKKIIFQEIQKKESLTTDELLESVIAFLDIEKFQYGSIKEIISGCATLIKDEAGEHKGQLDFIRPISKEEIGGFSVKIHRYSKDLVASIAEFINQSGAFLNITYGAYDWEELKESASFRLGTEKEIEPRKRVHEKFVERYSVIGGVINWMTFMKIIRPQFLNHRLGTIINELNREIDSERRFDKSYSHEELREADKKAERGLKSGLELARKKALEITTSLGEYTVDDVKELAATVLNPKNKYLFEDLLDICYTFGVTLDQASSIANTVNHLIEKRYYERFGGFLSPGFYKQMFLEAYNKFRSNYTEYKTNKLLEQGLDIKFERGVKQEVSKLYFSPELLISELLFGVYPSVKEYVARTLSMNDVQRQVGRLQYLKPLVINLLTELSTIEEKENEILALRKEANEKIANGKKPDEKEMEAIKKKEASLGRKKWFFQKRTFGVGADDVKDKLAKAYSFVATLINKEAIHPLQIKGDFIYAVEDLSNELLKQAGLFRVEKGLTIYNMRKNDLTHVWGEQFAGFPARLDHPSYHYTQLELNVIKNVLSEILKQNYVEALQMINSPAWKLSSLDTILANPLKQSNQDFIENLLCYNRQMNRYFGVVGSKQSPDNKIELVKKEFTPDGRSSFRPDLNYYKNDFFRKFFGLTPKDIDVNATIPRIIGGIINLGEDNSAQTKKEYGGIRQMFRNIILGRPVNEEYLNQLLQAAAGAACKQEEQGQLFPEIKKEE